MKISEVIETVKRYSYDEWNGRKIEEETTRDRVLFGDTDRECTGIITAIYASIEVIRKAAEKGANLIICHESLFWNHGDHTDWLENDRSFEAKKRLLQDSGITVWRDHDYIHAGLRYEGRRVDGIFYGLLCELGWESLVSRDVSFPLMVEIPETKRIFSPSE